MFAEFFLKLPFSNKTIKNILPNIMVLSSLVPNNSIVSKNILENFCKSVVVLGTYPLEKGDKVTVEKYDGILKDYNFWFLTLKKKNSVVYIPTSRVYNTIYEIHK
ncbi:hypothetical protein NGRA_0769 [Nosema granulosis]|uniref:Mechanosensitive ion channel MscS domain-containing protein n=1 Tax=Nosema granulosis TaxID=83296 RepID=A0A9P6H2E8_9MICR|nr:hypothetical protein NGRA_0769 [Nosema granulosis]